MVSVMVTVGAMKMVAAVGTGACSSVAGSGPVCDNHRGVSGGDRCWWRHSTKVLMVMATLGVAGMTAVW